MVLNLLIGLPGDRPGGLLLSLVYFFASGAAALALGCAYAVICVALPRASLLLCVFSHVFAPSFTRLSTVFVTVVPSSKLPAPDFARDRCRNRASDRPSINPSSGRETSRGK